MKGYDFFMASAIVVMERRGKALRKKRMKIALGIICLSVIVFLIAWLMYSKNNEARNELIKNTEYKNCHIVSVEEFPVTYSAEGSDIDSLTVNRYKLIGTYDFDDKPVVMRFNEMYADKESASEYLNTDRDAYILKNQIGVSGADEQIMIGLDKTFIVPICIGAVVFLAGIIVLIYPFEKHKFSES